MEFKMDTTPEILNSDDFIVSSLEQESIIRQSNFPLIQGILQFFGGLASGLQQVIPPRFRPTRTTITQVIK